ncbi:helix-turn-helix domain-containing protein [Vibrio parahaemolyticus]|uniref:helix-turn-helix domain-containing protein n=1 Tax=Vibrio natriegens TaxID=691 RepID=UPI001F8E32BE|nr:helix-turn-helix domain-containing protein [Vibrio natriegens]ELB2048964.1 helix-turn-helix domain-containing protein [Vibrio parahaemolyticus]CAH0523984.1 hypothetical protein CTH30272_00136 [Catenococcus thiocycli]ELB2166856.1 helix-turn-helix domain-containing protein [Vibrio parahaemolyticus]ELB2189433.1 helix-turn-helix domain-containing protein [Vibrio parahaemolyticus]ELB2194545.1 helix-turn-helix domain-containing protein [Vibrio parahaemolyticus]
MTNFLTPQQLSELLQVTEKTLANQRFEGRGIPFVKVERAVRYRICDIEAYLSKAEGNTDTQGTTEEGGYNEL